MKTLVRSKPLVVALLALLVGATAHAAVSSLQQSGSVQPGKFTVLRSHAVEPEQLDKAINEKDPDFAWKKGWTENVEWGGRVGFIDAKGNLKVRMKYVEGSPWVTVAHDVRDFQLLDWRLAVLKNDGTLWLQEQELSKPLLQIDQDIAAFQLTLTRVGALRSDGTFRVKELGFESATAATGVLAFQVLTDRVAVLGADGGLWLQYGGVVQGFTKIADRVESFQLEREWVAYTEDRVLKLAKGNSIPGLKFVNVTNNVVDFEAEVFVEMSSQFPSSLHLAVADGRKLYLGVGTEPTDVANLSVLAQSGTSQVHWAAGHLAALGKDGALKLGELRPDGGLTLAPELPGMASRIDLTMEGSVVIDRGSRSELLKIERATAAAGADAPVSLAKAQTDLEDVNRLQVSSLRPVATRRTVELGAEDRAAIKRVGDGSVAFPIGGTALVVDLPAKSGSPAHAVQ